MIRVRALGHLKPSLRKDAVTDLDEIRIRELVEIVFGEVNEKKSISDTAVLITVNGVEVSALQDDETVVESGDEVVFIPITHGG